MASRKSKSVFTSEELLVLQQAFDLACADLKLTPEGLREQLGVLIFEIAATGEADCAVLRRQSVRRFRNLLGARPAGLDLAGLLAPPRAKGPPRPRPGKR